MKSSEFGNLKRAGGFTLIEMLVVIALVAILASILLPALERSKARAQAVFCSNNARQLVMAWMTYADDHNGRLAYNLGSGNSSSALSSSTMMALNWADNVLSWDANNTDNTNFAKLLESGIGPYTGNNGKMYRCPADHVVSDSQMLAGWPARVRSYSMNAMVGDAGSLTQAGVNTNNPDYVQFFTASSILRPANIFVFLDEHPDSIDDGYFVNHAYVLEWHDLPASYHDGAGNFSFADGHVETHRWKSLTTTPPALPGGARLPIQLPASPTTARDDVADFYWVISRMSVENEQVKTTPPAW